MQPMNAANSRREGQGQGYEYVLILAGPGSRTVQWMPAPSFLNYEHIFDYDDDDDLAAAAHRSSKRSRVAASEEAILGLQEVTARSRDGEECAVCLHDFNADETLRAMPCSHAFHQQCIFKWLRRNAICPLCRHKLPEERERRI